jgi:hypothetical protein
MNKKLAIGSSTFVVLSIVLGLGVQAALGFAGMSSALAGHVGTHLVATPIALAVARKLGRVSRISLLVASLAISLLTLGSIVFILNMIAEPAGGHVVWSDLFTPTNWQSTVLGILATLVIPQLWLSLLNRLAANNSFKPKPLRGSA